MTTVSCIKIDFLFYFLEVQNFCNINLNTSVGAMTIPNNPSYVHQNLDCKITITIRNADYVILRWIKFGPQLFQDTSSCLNYIAIYNTSNSNNLVTKICSASNRIATPVASKNSVHIRYQIHNYNHLKNFHFSYFGGEYAATDVNTTITGYYGALPPSIIQKYQKPYRC